MVSFILPGNSATGGYEVANSCRFDRASSASMNRSMSDGSSIKSTFSAWVKVDGTDSEMNIMSHFEDTNNVFSIVTAGSSVYVADYNSGYSLQLATNRIMRDPSAWFHLYVAIDRSQGTASNRNRIFINGTEETSFAHNTNYSQQTSGSHENAISMNDGDCTMYIGQLGNGNQYVGGYLAEVVYLDGTVSDVTNFGEFDDDSPTIWKPIDVSGLSSSKGTNGFYLDFEDSSNLGNCAFGGTDFTEANLAATDQSTDTCTNNFAVMNSLANFRSGVGFSEGNLNIAMTNNKGGSTSTFGLTTGKWYVEMNITTMPADERFHLGIAPFEIQEQDDPISTLNQGIALSGFNAVIYADSGSGAAVLNNFFGNNTTRFDSFTGIIGMAVDMSSGTKTIAFSKAGAWVTGSGTTDTDFSNALKVDISTPFARHDVWHIVCGSGNSSGTTGVYSMNFGSPSFSISSGNADGNGYGNFEYAVPSGYYSINSKNLAEHG